MHFPIHPFDRIAALLLLVSCACPLHAETIFFNNFANKEAANLNGAGLDVGIANWVATQGSFLANGTIDGTGAGSATLAFAPSNGLIYTLDASFSNIAVTSGNDWIGFGFVNGQSVSSATTGTNTENRFLEGATSGIAWMMARGSNADFPNNANLGVPDNIEGAPQGGTTDVAAWQGGPTNGGNIDMRIVLDTTGGSGNWTATWYAKRDTDATFTMIRPQTVLLSEAITSVGFAKSNTPVTATITSFSLSDNSPPPPPPPDPPETLATLIPVTDGDPSTDSNGYAGSAINSIAFAQDNLITVGNQQFVSYYRQHATDPAHPDNNTVLIGRRTRGESQWEIFTTNFVSYDINDNHNVISMAIDGDGVLHMGWGMHGIHDTGPMNYAKSTASVLGTGPIEMVNLSVAGMTGQETDVTYPKFKTLPNGDLLFMFRMGTSGNGDWYLHRYTTATATWAPVHAAANGNTLPFIRGRGQTPHNCFYTDRLTLGPDGILHLSGVFRYRNTSSQAGETGYQTNHRYSYLRSPDEGITWQRSDGSTINRPVVNDASFLNLGPAHVPEIVEDLPEGSSLINQQGLTTDSQGRPVIATWFAANATSGDHTRQYHIYFHNGTTWQRRTISERDIDNPATKLAEPQLRSSRMGRPLVLTDAEDRIIVIYNDNRFMGITVAFTLPLAQDPDRIHWSRMNITHENLGLWEATFDEEIWNREGVLEMLYQPLTGMGMDYTGQNNSTPVSVASWDARAYFNGPIQWAVDTTSEPGHATVWAPAHAGFRYDLRTSTDLDFSGPPVESHAGDGYWFEFGTWPMNENRRFWQIQRTEEATGGL